MFQHDHFGGSSADEQQIWTPESLRPQTLAVSEIKNSFSDQKESKIEAEPIKEDPAIWRTMPQKPRIRRQIFREDVLADNIESTPENEIVFEHRNSSSEDLDQDVAKEELFEEEFHEDSPSEDEEGNLNNQKSKSKFAKHPSRRSEDERYDSENEESEDSLQEVEAPRNLVEASSDSGSEPLPGIYVSPAHLNLDNEKPPRSIERTLNNAKDSVAIKEVSDEMKDSVGLGEYEPAQSPRKRSVSLTDSIREVIGQDLQSLLAQQPPSSDYLNLSVLPYSSPDDLFRLKAATLFDRATLHSDNEISIECRSTPSAFFLRFIPQEAELSLYAAVGNQGAAPSVSDLVPVEASLEVPFEPSLPPVFPLLLIVYSRQNQSPKRLLLALPYSPARQSTPFSASPRVKSHPTIARRSAAKNPQILSELSQLSQLFPEAVAEGNAYHLIRKFDSGESALFCVKEVEDGIVQVSYRAQEQRQEFDEFFDYLFWLLCTF